MENYYIIYRELNNRPSSTGMSREDFESFLPQPIISGIKTTDENITILVDLLNEINIYKNTYGFELQSKSKYVKRAYR